jgi:threonyl-tRNA synthetase
MCYFNAGSRLFYTTKKMSSLTTLRQSTAELLALAVIDLFPGALLVESISTEQGFYCDIIAEQTIDNYAVPLIEEKMRALTKQNIEVRSIDMMREVAANFLEHKGQPFRADAVITASNNIISLIQIGDFYDYCEPPYIQETHEAAFFKIFSIEEVTRYTAEREWIKVKRIHGTVSTDKQSLKKHVKAIQAGKKGNHTRFFDKKLFSFQKDLSEASWVWESQGYLLKNFLIEWWQQEHRFQAFNLVASPSLIKKSFAKKAGIYEGKSSFSPLMTEIEGTTYIFTPSFAPAHMALFQEKTRSYKDLPIRYAECSQIFCAETKGSLWGVLDSRLVFGDNAHIFCAPEHIEEELISSLQFIDKTIKIFGLEYYWYFKGRGQKFSGKANLWEKAIKSFNSAFQKCAFTYECDQQESEFAGPTAEARLIDRFGREWKGPTVGFDFNAPDRLSLRYEGSDEKKYAPLMIVRTLFGSVERFAALLLEHSSGHKLIDEAEAKQLDEKKRIGNRLES